MTRPYVIATHEEIHDSGLEDTQGRPIRYITIIDALADGPNEAPRSWRVRGQQLRGSSTIGRRTPPRHVYSLCEAHTLAKTLYHRHLRYVEKRVALAKLKAEVAAETLEEMFQGH